jgi:hypothetical protein
VSEGCYRDTFDLQHSTLDFLKNEATDLIDNKGSGLAEIRNEATVWRTEGRKQKAENSRQQVEGRRQSAASRLASRESGTTEGWELKADD